MKKAKKIAISIVGSVAAIGVAVAGKIMYDKVNQNNVQHQLEYGVYNITDKVTNEKQLNIEYGSVNGAMLKETMQKIDKYNETSSKEVEYFGPSENEILGRARLPAHQRGFAYHSRRQWR